MKGGVSEEWRIEGRPHCRKDPGSVMGVPWGRCCPGNALPHGNVTGGEGGATLSLGFLERALPGGGGGGTCNTPPAAARVPNPLTSAFRRVSAFLPHSPSLS